MRTEHGQVSHAEKETFRVRVGNLIQRELFQVNIESERTGVNDSNGRPLEDISVKIGDQVIYKRLFDGAEEFLGPKGKGDSKELEAENKKLKAALKKVKSELEESLKLGKDMDQKLRDLELKLSKNNESGTVSNSEMV